MPEVLRKLGRKMRTGEMWFYRDFVALNPDPLLHQFERILSQLGDRIEANLEKLERYSERVPELSPVMRGIQRASRQLQEDLDALRNLYDEVSRALRDETGRFRPGTSEYQQLWREIREYMRIYTGGFEFILRVIASRIGG